jgi:twitching motility two-component system response regulator PilH
MTIRKILVVDDSKTELYYLSDLLGKKGYAVRTAENGEEALRRLAEEKPDLILMDVVMPGRTASSSRARSRATPAGPMCR